MSHTGKLLTFVLIFFNGSIVTYLTGVKLLLCMVSLPLLKRNIVSGVPQGSVMGPLLFTILSDDAVTRISLSSSISLYAKDVTLHRSISSPADYIILQANITAIVTCMEEEGNLKLHVDKYNLMLISRK